MTKNTQNIDQEQIQDDTVFEGGEDSLDPENTEIEEEKIETSEKKISFEDDNLKQDDLELLESSESKNQTENSEENEDTEAQISEQIIQDEEEVPLVGTFKL